MVKHILFTKDGYDALHKEYEELKATRPAAVQELRTASEMGDRSENAAYKVGRQKLSAIDRRLRYLEQTLRWAKIVESQNTEFVDIGCKVTVNDGKQTREFHIVGGHESDVMQGKISLFSPIGKTLIGKKVGDKVIVHVPAGQIHYTIESITI
jgi:transcription elongation factor GreA